MTRTGQTVVRERGRPARPPAHQTLPGSLSCTRHQCHAIRRPGIPDSRRTLRNVNGPAVRRRRHHAGKPHGSCAARPAATKSRDRDARGRSGCGSRTGVAIADAGARHRSSLAGRDFVRSIRSWRAHRLAVDRATEVRSRSRDDVEGRPPRALPPGERLHAAGVAGAGSPPRDRPSSPACATPAVGVFDRRRGCPEVTSTGPPGCAERHADGRGSAGDEAPPAAAAKEIVRPGAAPYNRGSAVPRRPR